ncbi:MAG: hypothetical protein RLY86_1296 [Pseudomonadota bacterium]
MLRLASTLRCAAVALTLGLAAAPAMAGNHAGHGGATQTIVEIAAGNDSFETLVAAVKAAGLAETLSGAGPFTVFAPTDDAFAKLPPGTVENLLKPENKAQLQKVLTYHVVAGKVMAADVKPGAVPTVAGPSATIAVADGKVTIDGATVTATDIVGSNGVIHVIDTVILPKE